MSNNRSEGEKLKERTKEVTVLLELNPQKRTRFCQRRKGLNSLSSCPLISENHYQILLFS